MLTVGVGGNDDIRRREALFDIFKSALERPSLSAVFFAADHLGAVFRVIKNTPEAHAAAVVDNNDAQPVFAELFGEACQLILRFICRYKNDFFHDNPLFHNDIIFNISQIMYNYKQTAKITDGKPPVTDCFYDFDYLRLF